jgi:hypothetical protein
MAKREAYFACSLKHPNVVEAWDLEERENEVFNSPYGIQHPTSSSHTSGYSGF